MREDTLGRLGGGESEMVLWRCCGSLVVGWGLRPLSHPSLPFYIHDRGFGFRRIPCFFCALGWVECATICVECLPTLAVGDLLGKSGKHLGHLIEVRIQRTNLPDHFVQRHILCPAASKPNHHPRLCFGESLDRCRSHTTSQDPVEGCGAPASLDVPQHRQARRERPLGVVYVFVDISGSERCSLCSDHDEVWLALFPGPAERLHDLLWLRLELRDQHDLSPPGYAAHERQVAAAATHHLDDVGSLVGACSVLYAVYGLKCGVERCVHPYGRVGGEDVVIYRCGDTHYLDPALLQPQRPRQAPLPTNHHEPFHACLLQPTGRKLLSFWGGKLRGTGGSQHRAAPLEDASYPTVVQRVEAALQQPSVAGFYPHDLPASGEGGACDRPHRSVHARCVAAAGQNSYLHVTFLLVSCTINKSPGYQKAILLIAEALRRPCGHPDGVNLRSPRLGLTGE